MARGDLRALWRVRCQHPVVAVTVQARGRDQCGQALDQFQGRGALFGASIGLGLGEAIDELVVSAGATNSARASCGSIRMYGAQDRGATTTPASASVVG